jgi:hypothetical protein
MISYEMMNCLHHSFLLLTYLIYRSACSIQLCLFVVRDLKETEMNTIAE